MTPISKPRRPWITRQTETAPDCSPAVPVEKPKIPKPPAAPAKKQEAARVEVTHEAREDEFGNWKFTVKKPPAAKRD